MDGDLRTNEDIVLSLLKKTVPERVDELTVIWNRFSVCRSSARKKGITMNANKERIQLDNKTLRVVWLIGFSAWKAIECYSPWVIFSSKFG